MKNSPKHDKGDIRQLTRLTRPPRLQPKVKEANMQPVKKPRQRRPGKTLSGKPQGYSERQRKEYQLGSRR